MSSVAADSKTEELGKQCLSFLLNDELYAIEVSHVHEIIPPQELTAIPNTPSYIHGVTNLRGRVATIVDLKEKFSIPRKEERNPNEVYLVLNLEASVGEETLVGIIVDGLDDVITVSQNQIEEDPSMRPSISAQAIEGIVCVSGKFRALLDVGKLFIDEVQQAGD